MAVDFSAADELTGVDLSEVALLIAYNASTFAERWGNAAFGDFADEAEAALVAGITELASVPPIANGIAGLNVALGAVATWTAVRDALSAEMSAAQAANVRRIWEARDAAIQSTYRPGQWWTRVEGSGPEEVQLKKKYNQSVASFTGQYSPSGIVFSAAKGTGRDVLFPSFPSSPGRPQDRFYAWGGEQGLAETLPSLAVKQTDAPLCGDLNYDPCRAEIENNFFRRLHGLVCAPLDFTQGCGLPGRFWWSYCLGLAPNWGWLGQPFPLGPLGTTLSAAINSPTPFHLKIAEADVRASLKAIVTRCGVLDLPEDPGQTQNGVFRRGLRLVLRGPQAKYWTANTPNNPAPLITAEELRDVIDRHLDWLALRRSILLTLPGLPDPLQTAAKEAPDESVRLAVGGTPPTDAWRMDDPLDLFPKSGGGVGQGPGGEKGEKSEDDGPGGNGPGGRGGGGGGQVDEPSTGGGGGLLLGLGALAFVGGGAIVARNMFGVGKKKGRGGSRRRSRGGRRRR